MKHKEFLKALRRTRGVNDLIRKLSKLWAVRGISLEPIPNTESKLLTDLKGPEL